MSRRGLTSFYSASKHVEGSRSDLIGPTSAAGGRSDGFCITGNGR